MNYRIIIKLASLKRGEAASFLTVASVLEIEGARALAEYYETTPRVSDVQVWTISKRGRLLKCLPKSEVARAGK